MSLKYYSSVVCVVCVYNTFLLLYLIVYCWNRITLASNLDCCSKHFGVIWHGRGYKTNLVSSIWLVSRCPSTVDLEQFLPSYNVLIFNRSCVWGNIFFIVLCWTHLFPKYSVLFSWQEKSDFHQQRSKPLTLPEWG